MQGLLLGAFYYGYTPMQIIGGIVVRKVGGKLLILLGLASTSLLTLLTPIITTVGGFAALFAIRLLEGVGQVCTCVISFYHSATVNNLAFLFDFSLYVWHSQKIY